MKKFDHKVGITLFLLSLTVGCKNDGKSQDSDHTEFTRQQQAHELAVVTFQKEKEEFDSGKQAAQTALDQQTRTHEANLARFHEQEETFRNESQTFRSERETAQRQVETQIHAERERVQALHGTWQIMEAFCDEQDATTLDAILSDLYTEPKSMFFSFSAEDPRHGNLIVMNEGTDGAADCRLTIPFVYDLFPSAPAPALNAMKLEPAGEATFYPLQCNQPSAAQSARSIARGTYNTFRPYFKYIGISDPLATIAAYADPVMGFLGRPTNTRQIVFGREQAPTSLLTYYVPSFLHYGWISQTDGTEKIIFRANNYYGCRKRLNPNLFSPNIVEMTGESVESLE